MVFADPTYEICAFRDRERRQEFRVFWCMALPLMIIHVRPQTAVLRGVGIALFVGF